MQQSARESLEVRMGPVFYHENVCLIQKQAASGTPDTTTQLLPFLHQSWISYVR